MLKYIKIPVKTAKECAKKQMLKILEINFNIIYIYCLKILKEAYDKEWGLK